MIVIQTDNLWPVIQESCMNTWSNQAEEKGYRVVLVNFKQTESSFIDILIDQCIKESQKFVIVGFDDLFFNFINLPEFKDLSMMFFNEKIDAIRLDGRVPGNGEFSFILNKVPYYRHYGAYQLSTVFTAFSLDLLLKMRGLGIESAWEIEEFKSKDFIVASPRVRTMKYNNLIVKGKLDPFFIDKYCISLSFSLLRKTKRLANRIARFFSKFLF